MVIRVSFFIAVTIFVTILCQFAVTGLPTDAYISIQESLKRAGIIPDVVDDFTPVAILNVKYGEKDVTLGNEFTIEETANAPTIMFEGEVDELAQYTLLMVDPDVPNPENKNWRHWIVGNIPRDYSKFETDSTVVTPYNGPAPPPGTGLHRYIFLLYHQPYTYIKFQTLPDFRGGFNVHTFAEQYGLQLISANFFLCKSKQ